jgi:hypothetical protein
MKKTIITMIIFQLMMITATFAMSDPQPIIEDKNPKAIWLVEINADVTVVLGQFGNKKAFIDGDEEFRQQIVIRHMGHRLVISSLKNKDLRDKGVIYISAESLGDLQINSAAYVQSSGTLNVPLINVLINGACQVMLANTGEMNFVPGGQFDIEYKTRNDLNPLAFYKSRKK